MILLIDNYDSFTYNLVQRFGEIDKSLDIEVHRNDKITLDEIAAKKPTHLVISPRSMHAQRGGRFGQVRRTIRRKVAHSWRLPGSSIDRPSDRWQDRPPPSG